MFCYKKCPDRYNKIILSEKRCIENCKNYDIYWVDFNNICMRKCPVGTEYNGAKKISPYYFYYYFNRI